MSNYQYSRVFNTMKSAKEHIAGNLTSLQYLQTLDYFIWNALEPVIRTMPNYWINYCSKTVLRQLTRPAAKFTSDDKGNLPHMLAACIRASSPSNVVKISKAMYLNRGILFGFIAMLREEFAEYIDVCEGRTDLSYAQALSVALSYEVDFNCPNLYSILKTSYYWDDLAFKFKGYIFEKYNRLALNNAQSTYTEFDCILPLDDIICIYQSIANRAIDRCDARRGVLTTFIQSWFKSAKTEVAKQVTHIARTKSIEAMMYVHGDGVHDMVGTYDLDTSYEETQSVRDAAYRVDPEGILALHLGVLKPLSDEDRRLLHLLKEDYE